MRITFRASAVETPTLPITTPDRGTETRPTAPPERVTPGLPGIERSTKTRTAPGQKPGGNQPNCTGQRLSMSC